MKKLVIAFALLMLVGCGSINIVRPEYTPRISDRSLAIEKNLASETQKGTILILKFQDKRMDYKEKNETELKSKGLDFNLDDFKGPLFIYNASYLKGAPIEYRFKTKPLSDYLYGSLIFDLTRLGFNIISNDKSDLSFQEIINNRQTIPANTSYVVSVDVLMCEPGFVSHWNTVDVFYYYYYYVRIYDVLKSQVLYNAELKRTVEGTPEMFRAQLASVIDRLLNDYLFEINYDIAEILVKHK